MTSHDRILADIEARLQALSLQLGPNRAIYVSTPITSGWRFIEWYEREGRKLAGNIASYASAHRREVIDANSREASTQIAALRRRWPTETLLDPTELSMPAWSQDDYRFFWGKVIERYVDKAIFLNGWEASNGCAYEFSVAWKSNVPVFAQSGSRLTVRHAVKLIQKAIDAIEKAGLDGRFLCSIVTEMRSWPSAKQELLN